MSKLESVRSAAADIERRLPTAEWNSRDLISREWLVTNGLGGYASGTLAGPPTRRYHSLLVAALPAPLGRLALLAHLDERIRLPHHGVGWLSRRDDSSPVVVSGFTLVGGLPVWRYVFDGIELEKRLFMPNEQNSIFVTYTLIKRVSRSASGCGRWWRSACTRRRRSHGSGGAGRYCASTLPRGERGRGRAHDQTGDSRSRLDVHVHSITEDLHYELEDSAAMRRMGIRGVPATTSSISPSGSRSPSSRRPSACQ
jgi:hypothetical protein